MIASAVVHTAGINWAGVAANLVTIAGTIGAILAIVLSRLDRRRNAHEKWVTDKIEDAGNRWSQALGGRVDTLAADIGEHLRHQDATIERLDRRTYRIETRLMRNRD